MSDTPPSGFLQRWSRRKIEARQEPPVRHDEGVAAPDAATEAGTAHTATDPSSPPSAMPLARDARSTPADDAAPALPTLDDVRALTADSDYSAFVAREVSPEVKNAALKKLFTDPHYNVMDGLDIYIDDYSQQAPLPESMLRKMAVSKVFGFFEDEARCAAGTLLNDPAAAGAGSGAEAPGVDTPGVATPGVATLAPPDETTPPTPIGTPVPAADDRHSVAGTDPRDCDPAPAVAQQPKH